MDSDLFFQAVNVNQDCIRYYTREDRGSEREGRGERKDDKMILEENLRI